MIHPIIVGVLFQPTMWEPKSLPLRVDIVEAPILDQDPTGNSWGTKISIWLRLNFDPARIELQPSYNQ